MRSKDKDELVVAVAKMLPPDKAAVVGAFCCAKLEPLYRAYTIAYKKEEDKWLKNIVEGIWEAIATDTLNFDPVETLETIDAIFEEMEPVPDFLWSELAGWALSVGKLEIRGLMFNEQERFTEIVEQHNYCLNSYLYTINRASTRGRVVHFHPDGRVTGNEYSKFLTDSPIWTTELDELLEVISLVRDNPLDGNIIESVKGIAHDFNRLGLNPFKRGFFPRQEWWHD